MFQFEMLNRLLKVEIAWVAPNYARIIATALRIIIATATTIPSCLAGRIPTSFAAKGAAIDVFPIEPEKNGDPFSTPLQGLSNVILTPHIGGSTEEAQENIGEDVSIKLYQYLERGVSYGSHTIPSISLPPVENAHRILHIHNNVPGVLSAINTVMSKNKINIVGQYLKTNDEIGYVVLDVDSKLSKTAISLLKEVKHTIRARMLY